MSVLGVTANKRKRFVHHFSAPLSKLREMAANSINQNENFFYFPNPLMIYPMIRTFPIGSSGHRYLLAPIPTYLFHRFTAGVYYELLDDPGFGHAFGLSFQHYVGEVLKRAMPEGHFSVLEEQEYRIGKKRKDSVDWIVSDATGHLFVECKTHRMRLSSKMELGGRESLTREIERMADSISKTYITMADAAAGYYPHWKDDKNCVYPIIVLLEDWFLFDPDLISTLDKLVNEKLAANAVSSSVVSASPYTICSCADFEVLVQVIAMTSVHSVMSGKHEDEKMRWNVKSFLFDQFPDEVGRVKKGLFDDEFSTLHPAIADARAGH
jgi:hypothetical protein